VTGILEESAASIITRGNGSQSILVNVRICLPGYTTSNLRTILSSQRGLWEFTSKNYLPKKYTILYIKNSKTRGRNKEIKQQH